MMARFIASFVVVSTLSAAPAIAAQGVHGVVTLGPNCPGPAQIGQPSCDDRPYATRLTVFRADGKRAVRVIASDAEGAFSIALPPGQYEIRSRHGGLPYCGSNSFAVSRGVFVNVKVACDTGMR